MEGVVLDGSNQGKRIQSRKFDSNSGKKGRKPKVGICIYLLYSKIKMVLKRRYIHIAGATSLFGHH